MFFREKRITPTDAETSAVLSSADGALISGTILDISEFGVKISLSEDEIFSVSQRVNTVLKINGRDIFSGSAYIVYTGSGVLGLRLTDSGCDVAHIIAVLDTSKTAFKINQFKHEVSDEFKVLVADFVYLMSAIKSKLDVQEKYNKSVADDFGNTSNLDRISIENALEEYATDIAGFYDKFDRVVTKSGAKDLPALKSYFRTVFHPILLQAPFIERAYKKPLGYAGDYGLMVMLYDHNDLGKSLFSRFFHRFTCNEPAAIANRNRIDILRDAIVRVSKGKKAFKVSIVACGPCREIETFLLSGPPDGVKIEFICLDQEERSLEYAQTRLYRLIGGNQNITVRFMGEDAVLGIIKKKPHITAALRDSDLMISAGLFDYLSDRVSTKLITSMYDLVKADGELLIGNVAKDNPSKFSMSFLTEWELILRDKTDLGKLLDDDLKSKCSYEVFGEPLGLNLFLRVKK